MKRTTFFSFVALLFTLLSCQPPAGGPIEGTTWELVYMNGEIPEGMTIDIVFEDGKLSGKGVCNRYFADYGLDGGNLKIGPVGATKMMCPENAMLESQYFGILPQAQTFSVKGETLSITCEGAKLRFVKGVGSSGTNQTEE
ncbi:MAG: META domain-containing protein [Phaeodactylibacter sp.]|nr:META domain-containing protein [Phaeodactylibacter sp.]MCB9294918.1 META domain-containing protein [Lewinellaceae bacterium]